MHIATRFSIGVHILSLLGTEPEPGATSEFMAGSIGVNAVVVRNVTGMLRRAGLVSTSQGVAGTRLARDLADITLLDVYRAVETDTELFGIHQNPHPDCPVGANIQATLENVFHDAQRAMEERLGATTMGDIVLRLQVAAAAGK